jgi:hypothetical protein
MFTKPKEIATVRGKVYKRVIDWGAVVFWGFIGLVVLGAIAN